MAQLQNHRKYLTVITIILIAGVSTLIWPELYKTPVASKVRQGIATDSRKLTERKSTDSGVFVFNNQDMKSILKELSKSYKMELVYKGGTISNKTYFGTFSRSENIADILSFLQKQTDIKLTIENSKIIVVP